MTPRNHFLFAQPPLLPRINDVDGYERFGLGLQADGNMGMGFDAPPGTGDPRNRERITIVADRNGGADIRFLDRKTSIAGYLILDDKNRLYLEFWDYTDKKIIKRRFSFNGEDKVEESRQRP